MKTREGFGDFVPKKLCTYISGWVSNHGLIPLRIDGCVRSSPKKGVSPSRFHKSNRVAIALLISWTRAWRATPWWGFQPTRRWNPLNQKGARSEISYKNIPVINLAGYSYIATARAVRTGTFLWTRSARPQKCPKQNGDCYTFVI
jgi:hypothetical protein